jgi:hypothetical protein
VLLPACAGASATPDLRTIGEPVYHRGRVEQADGPLATDVGEDCTVRVDRIDHPTFNCRIRIRCGEDFVYGIADSGYNRCLARRTDGVLVQAEDSRGTSRDGDPRMTFDLSSGRIVVSDDDPDIEVLVLLGPAPPDAYYEDRPLEAPP